jgi:Ni,Fe-hydrogenase maturation factor
MPDIAPENVPRRISTGKRQLMESVPDIAEYKKYVIITAIKPAIPPFTIPLSSLTKISTPVTIDRILKI